ncbi:hypothetical protein F2Q69_00021245 [Brassica cretica]|uniref:No apical meristem-associated C-terminal domain-containing protein n=1 Tax=Brassica cretica TaxID=69181 RepID=A0A8S9Q691_BRACR|nr:hypothetical protein F2Q69_00021245 [Brassica cretica]
MSSLVFREYIRSFSDTITQYYWRDERREEERVFGLFGFSRNLSRKLSIFVSEKGDCLSLCGSLTKGDTPSPWLREETAILPLRGSSFSVARRRNDDSLSLRGSSRKRKRSSLSLGCCRRGGKSLIISLTVGILNGEEPLSLSLYGSTGIGWFNSFSWWLSSTVIYGSLSVALLNGDGALCRWLSEIRSVKENNAGVDDDVTCRPASVKAAKARGKKPLVEAKELDDFKTIWEMKKEDLARKEKLTKMKLLESLFAKQGPLPDYEEDLKIKLIKELM